MIFILIEDIVIIVSIDKGTFKKTSFFGGSRLLSLNDSLRRLDAKKAPQNFEVNSSPTFRNGGSFWMKVNPYLKNGGL